MNKKYLILGLCGLLAFAACNEEMDDPNAGKPGPEVPADVITTDSFVAVSYEEPAVPETEAEVAPGTKVSYHKKDNVFSAKWSKDDYIHVTAAGADEEITLQPFQLEGEGGVTTGKFVGEPISGTTFSAVFSKAVPTVSADRKSIEVLFPAEQNYVEEGLEDHLVPMFAVTSDPQNLKFQYGSGILRLNLYSGEELSVSKIEVVTDVPAAGVMYVTPCSGIFPCGFSGGASVNDMEGVELKSGAASTNTVTYNVGGVAVGRTAEEATQFNIALAASNHGTEVEKNGVKMNVYKEMIVRVYTTDGKVMAKVQRNFQVLPGVVHDFSPLPFTDNSVPEINYTKSTSTSLTFAWSQTGKAKNDVLDSYEVALYSDEACQNLVVSWTLPAEDKLFYPFSNEVNADHTGFPAFTFTGLAQNTDYWCKVRNLNTGAVCSAAKATTGEFAVKAVGTSKAAAGDVVLAEDFSELVWGGDFVTPAAGYVADDEIRSVFSAATGADNSNYAPRVVSRDYNLTLDIPAAVAATERLSAWDYICEDGNTEKNGLRVYSCASYLRIGSGTNTANVVTPVLSNLEEGKNATLLVKFKAAPYYDTNKADKADPDHIQVAVINSIADNHKYADCTVGNVVTAQLNGTQNEWKEYTLEISGVTSSSRIAIGTYRPSGVSGYIRMFLDDVEITVKKYDEVKARLQGATSSTLSFQWSGNNFTDAEADTKVPYTVALYEDAACATLVASWNIEADNENYHTSKDGVDYYFQPAFNFSGLEANKTYYFKATDTQNNLVSNVVSATTEAFTNVKVEGTVAAGGVVLAEDFSQLVWDGDFIYPGITYTAQNAIDNKNVGTIAPSTGDTHDGFVLRSPSRETSLTSAAYKEAIKSTRLNGWSFNSEEDGTRVFGRLGHIKVGSGSYTGRIITPALSNLQQTATLKISFKASPYYDHNQQSMIDPLDACIKVIAEDGTETSAHKFTLKDEKNKWNDYSFNVINVEPGSKISIGTYRANGTAGKQQRRMYIDDIKIEVLEYTDAVGARLKRATSSTLTFEWSPSGFTDLATDRAKDYNVSLYSDDTYTTAVAYWTLPASAELYRPWSYEAGAVHPAFIFTGLETRTTYYFKVDDGNGWVRKAMASTESFEVVEIGTAKVSQGGTLLAEDFSEFVWFGDLSSPAGGYCYTEAGDYSLSKTGYKSQVSITPAPATGHDKYEVVTCSVDKPLFSDLATPIKSTRIGKGEWGQSNENTSQRVYVQAGHLRLGGGNKTASIVTPVLSNIEEGKVAKVTVSFKACPYYDSNVPETGDPEGEKTPDPDNFHISLFRGETSRASGGYITSTYGAVEVKTDELNSARNTWKEYSYDIDNVISTSRIAIGTKKPSGHTTNVRMYIDDIKIVVKEYTDAVKPTVEVQGVTSSTVSFKWSVNGFTNAKTDYARPARVELYEDEACTSDKLVVAWNILDVSKYKSMQPAFTFTGLNSNTTYYFRVTDVYSGLTSDVISAKTSDFTITQIDANQQVEVGGTVLAEDFSQLVWDGNYVYPGVAYRTSKTAKADIPEFTKATGDNPSGYTLITATDEKQVFGDWYTNAYPKTRLATWGLENYGRSGTGGVYNHAGYVKLSTSATNGAGRIVTPKLANLKGTATVKVSFKTCPYPNEGDLMDGCIAVLDNTPDSGANLNLSTSSTTVSSEKNFTINETLFTWSPCEQIIENVTPSSRLSIGVPLKTGKRRMQIDDIVITVVSYNE